MSEYNGFWWPETDTINKPHVPVHRESFSNPELEQAVGRGDTHTIESILDQNDACLDLDFDKSGRTMLQLAAQGGHEEVVRLLLDRGADINIYTYNHTPMNLALCGGHIPVVKALLERGATITMEDVRVVLGTVMDPRHKPFTDYLLTCTTNSGPMVVFFLIMIRAIGPLQEILKAHPRFVHAADKFGKVPLHHAAR